MFKDIKVGDKVLVRVHQDESISRRMTFWVAREVHSTTPKFFKLFKDGFLYAKTDGFKRGSVSYEASVRPYSEADDQTEEASVYADAVTARRKAAQMLDDLAVTLRSGKWHCMSKGQQEVVKEVLGMTLHLEQLVKGECDGQV